jgi:hypothetical protein
MRNREQILAVLTVFIAALALIPAFGQWLVPREPVAVSPTAPPLPATPSPAVIATSGSFDIYIATDTPIAASTTTSSPDFDFSLSPAFYIAEECNAMQYNSTVLTSFSDVLLLEIDPRYQDDVQLVKQLVILAKELAFQSALQQDPLCAQEILSGPALVEHETAVANVDASGLISIPTVDWSQSQLRAYQRVNDERIEATVCFSKSVGKYDQQGMLVTSNAPEIVAQSYVFERVSGNNRYYATSTLALEPSNLCQS